MYAKIRSLGLRGIGGYEVELETYISTGLPRFDIVGLPDAVSVKDRRQGGFQFRYGVYVLHKLTPVSL